MYIADLHIHSKYSRATSRDCTPEFLDLWARKKGIDIIGTGDFTHPGWREELEKKLCPAEEGLYVLREEFRLAEPSAPSAFSPRFVVTGEISSIYKKNGRVRKVHNLILLPGLEAAGQLALRLEAIGNLHSDGRPILGLDSRDLLEIMLEACPDGVFVPAHIWTPHFSVFGAFSGFDTLEECFEDLTPYIHALETGLSSDPPMNWRISALDSLCLISNSDAHSPARLGREANLLDIKLSYPALAEAIQGGREKGLAGTIEFFPEEGKYHYDGHRNCDICLTPAETLRYGGRCPVCGKKLTIGVEHRVEELANRPEGFAPAGAAAYESLVPLAEVIAASTLRSPGSVRVAAQYEDMLQRLGNEFYILREAPLEEIGRYAGPCVQEGIRRLRRGQVERTPGFDGRYGSIRLLNEAEIDELNGQMSFFMECASKGVVRKKTELKAGVKEAASAPEPAEEERTFNEGQREAVSAEEKTVSVIAGPGTGKTAVLIGRIAWLMEEKGVKASQITAVTFTNKAAEEMRRRLKERLTGKRMPGSLQIGTFHSLCLTLLKGMGEEPRLLDEPEAMELARALLEEKGLKLPASHFLNLVSACKNGVNRKKNHSAENGLSEEILAAWEAVKEERGVMDFDDLLLRTLELWEDKSGRKEKAHFQYILVDEFQDINEIQYQLLCAWSREGKGLFLIGDPDQAIYSFRGSDSGYFDRLAAEKEKTGGFRTVCLTENYRSTPEILSCALPVISADGKERRLAPNRESGALARLIQTKSDLSEGIFIAKEINREMGGVDMLDVHDRRFRSEERSIRGFSDFAVLYRTHRQARIIERCLGREGIPYIVTGREDYLYDPAVREAVGFFRFLLSGDEPEAAPAAGWNERLLKYRPLIKKEKPPRLLEEWAKDLKLDESRAFDQLIHAAVFHKTMTDFLNALLLGQESDWMRASARKYSSGAVRLMTFHGSKGMEFPVVFLCGLKKGLVPLEQAGRSGDPKEERRLFYVGMTRAREELILLTSEEPSVFLSDIPDGCLAREEAGKRLGSEEKQMKLSDFVKDWK